MMQQTSQTRLLRDHLDEVIPAGGLERALDEKFFEAHAEDYRDRAESEEEAARAIDAVQRLGRDEELSSEDRDAVEAIILPTTRPVIDVERDSFVAPDGYWNLLGQEAIRERIENAIPSVGRIELPRDPRYKYAGTGFVVGPGLLMTNRHVAEIFIAGLGREGVVFKPGQTAISDFREEASPSPSINVRIIDVVMVHPHFDMALLRVAELPDEQAPLSMSTVHPADLSGRDVAVIGYPAFDGRNPASVQNRIFRGVYDVKRLQPGTLTGLRHVQSYGNSVHSLTHNASTLGGNSGSAIVDLATGAVVGLHFAGRYKVANYAVPSYELARDPYVREAGVLFGGSVSAGTVPWMERWREADPPQQPSSSSATNGTYGGGKWSVPTDAPNRPGAQAPANRNGDLVDAISIRAGEAVITIPIRISVSLGAPMPTGPHTGSRTGPAAAQPQTTAARRRSVDGDRQAIVSGLTEAPPTIPDPDYSNREGYDPHFLDGHYVRMPWLDDDQYLDTAKNSETSTSRHVLPYHHFSVVMSKKRRMAYFTAVNIDGGAYWHITRDDFDDYWSLDPRVSEAYQLDNDFYKKWNGVDNPLDRGHLVRRLDPCWGSTWDEVVAAHHDTFHYTNAAPQHSSFNRVSTVWRGIEDYVLKKAAKKDLRVSVFTGPVFDHANDEWYHTPTGLELQLPKQYWKVVATVDEHGQLFATGYLLSQEGLIADMVEAAPYGAFRTYQVTVAEIEQLTRLWFWGLADHDPLVDHTEAAPGAYPDGRRIELHAAEEIVLSGLVDRTLPAKTPAPKRATTNEKSAKDPAAKKRGRSRTK